MDSVFSGQHAGGGGGGGGKSIYKWVVEKWALQFFFFGQKELARYVPCSNEILVISHVLWMFTVILAFILPNIYQLLFSYVRMVRLE
jgi:hypothetical protein